MNARSTKHRLKLGGLPRKTLILGSLIVLAAASGGAWWWTHHVGTAGDGASSTEKPTTGGNPSERRLGGGGRVQPVSVTEIKKQDIRVVLSAIGNITAANTATVRARVEGELKAIHFAEGQQVKAGALLAEIDPRNYEIQLAQTQGQLARDAAQLRNAQLDLERYKDLLAKDSIARQQVESQDALVRQLIGTVQSDQAQMDNAKLQLSYTKIVAPISGKLGFKQVDLGNVVRSSDALGLVNITQTQPIAVVFGVPETNLPQINAQLKAAHPLQVEAWDREQKIKLATGKVQSTDNSIDLPTGTIKVKADFANADNTLFPNQFVNIRLQVAELKDALVVPASAIQRGAQGIFVYVVKPDSSVTVRRVRLGITEGDLVSIEGDVAAQEPVVTDGADRLREGAKVDVITPGSDVGKERRESRSAPPATAGNTESRTPRATEGGSERPRERAGERTGERRNGPGGPSGPGGEGGERGARMLDRLPPDVADKVRAMNPEDRRAFFQKMREQRRQEGQ